MISINVNNELIQWDERLNLEKLVKVHKLNTAGVVLALNAQLVPRSRWQDIYCQDSDSVEFFSAVAGG